jgi:hypothetical protein
MEPFQEFQPGFFAWNVGFAIGKSNRQLNDWYWKRKNKRARSIRNQMVGRSGLKAIRRGFEEVLRMRWLIPPGDAIVLDCTSGDPDRQFRAWSRWHRYHPEWLIDFEKKEFLWYRPPFADDPIRKTFDITALVPDDPTANTADERYFECFRVHPKVATDELSMSQIAELLSPVLSS